MKFVGFYINQNFGLMPLNYPIIANKVKDFYWSFNELFIMASVLRLLIKTFFLWFDKKMVATFQFNPKYKAKSTNKD